VLIAFVALFPGASITNVGRTSWRRMSRARSSRREFARISCFFPSALLAEHHLCRGGSMIAKVD